MRIWLVLALACGGTPAKPVETSSTPEISTRPHDQAVSDYVDSRDAEMTLDHAHRFVAAVLDWRRAHSGNCPTAENIIAEYTFPGNAATDATGERFALECSGPEVRILARGRVVLVERDDPGAGVDAAPPAIAARLRACYELALRQNPNLTGSVHGEIVIAPSGIVKQVVVDSKRTTANDPELLRCVQSRLKGVSSEVDTKKKETRVTF